jgi:hypothetical protein
MRQWLPVLFVAAMAATPSGEAIAQSDSPAAMPSGKTERIVSTSATVEAIDLNKRVVVLRQEDGTEVAVEVDQRVKNLPQVRVGDRLQVKYREAVAFQVKPAGELKPSTSVKEGLTTAKPGDKPAGVRTQEVTIVATIDAIDPSKPSVRLRTADGEVTEIRVRDPNNLKKVKVGDHVEVIHSTALAISVAATPSAASGSSAPTTRSPAPTTRSKASVTAKELNQQELDRIQSGQ